MQNHPNIKLNAYHMKIRDYACFKALAAKLFDFPLSRLQKIKFLLQIKQNSIFSFFYILHSNK